MALELFRGGSSKGESVAVPGVIMGAKGSQCPRTGFLTVVVIGYKNRGNYLENPKKIPLAFHGSRSLHQWHQWELLPGVCPRPYPYAYAQGIAPRSGWRHKCKPTRLLGVRAPMERSLPPQSQWWANRLECQESYPKELPPWILWAAPSGSFRHRDSSVDNHTAASQVQTLRVVRPGPHSPHN